MKYLDLVELINDRPEYEKAGVKKGMFGAVMSEESTDGKWQVVFSEFYTGENRKKPNHKYHSNTILTN